MLHLILKTLSGMVIIPIALLMTVLWEWWEKQEGFKKYAAGAFILPLGLIMLPIAMWWEEF